jgi:hypothetical protein
MRSSETMPALDGMAEERERLEKGGEDKVSLGSYCQSFKHGSGASALPNNEALRTIDDVPVTQIRWALSACPLAPLRLARSVEWEASRRLPCVLPDLRMILSEFRATEMRVGLCEFREA